MRFRVELRRKIQVEAFPESLHFRYSVVVYVAAFSGTILVIFRPLSGRLAGPLAVAFMMVYRGLAVNMQAEPLDGLADKRPALKKHAAS